ncbi:uncharacterized protein LOC143711004 isoform X1 [Siphateles boraxobius]|uniref:uncharacterized protein LOC143711004 isoform X1 n=1 Tax=Siphateles boraxobius TaxID=180520 RepID=UPI004062C650
MKGWALLNCHNMIGSKTHPVMKRCALLNAFHTGPLKVKDLPVQLLLDAQLLKGSFWRGQKTGLKSQPIHQVLLSAVLRNPAQQNSTEADVEMSVRNWLRLSMDRNGGGKGARKHLK